MADRLTKVEQAKCSITFTELLVIFKEGVGLDGYVNQVKLIKMVTT